MGLTPRRSFVVALALGLALVASACFVVKGVNVREVQRREGTRVSSRVKVHLLDGGTVMFPQGVRVEGSEIIGDGERFGLRLNPLGQVSAVALDSVVAMESFSTSVRPAETMLVSTLATVGTIGLTVAIAVAIACSENPKCFGSCPTVYSDSLGHAVLEAEGFSYSIAPLFEMRDVDRLRVQAHDGRVTLEVRNEAFETHYINHLELLEIRHAAGEVAVPDPRGGTVVLGDLTAPVSARDHQRADRLAEVAQHDGVVFATSAARLRDVRPGDLEDDLELVFELPEVADSAALAFRLRNSLLATVLFYEVMIGKMGAQAADWMANDLDRISVAVELGRWAAEQLGMRVEVFDGSAYRLVGRVRDTGPVAWNDVALVVPTFGAKVLRVRLRFPADNWRIDRIAATVSWRRAQPRTVPLALVLDATGQADTVARAALAAPDEHYLVTRAGDRFAAHFDVGDAADGARTFLLATQGYYIEWIRRPWITHGERSGFTPGPEALHEAMVRWRTSQAETERAFYATRVPVR